MPGYLSTRLATGLQQVKVLHLYLEFDSLRQTKHRQNHSIAIP